MSTKYDVGTCCGCPPACSPCDPPTTDLTVTVSGTFNDCVGGVFQASAPYSHSWPLKYYPGSPFPGPPDSWVTDCLSDGPFVGGHTWKFQMSCVLNSLGMNPYDFSGTTCPASPSTSGNIAQYGTALSSSTCSPINLVYSFSPAKDLFGCCGVGCSIPNFHLTTITVTP